MLLQQTRPSSNQIDVIDNHRSTTAATTTTTPTATMTTTTTTAAAAAALTLFRRSRPPLVLNRNGVGHYNDRRRSSTTKRIMMDDDDQTNRYRVSVTSTISPRSPLTATSTSKCVDVDDDDDVLVSPQLKHQQTGGDGCFKQKMMSSKFFHCDNNDDNEVRDGDNFIQLIDNRNCHVHQRDNFHLTTLPPTTATTTTTTTTTTTATTPLSFITAAAAAAAAAAASTSSIDDDDNDNDVVETPHRLLFKLKKFLKMISDFSNNLTTSKSDKVKQLITKVVHDEIDAEQFYEQLQTLSLFPLRPYVVPFMKASLPLLRKEYFDSRLSSNWVDVLLKADHCHMIATESSSFDYQNCTMNHHKNHREIITFSNGNGTIGGGGGANVHKATPPLHSTLAVGHQLIQANNPSLPPSTVHQPQLQSGMLRKRMQYDTPSLISPPTSKRPMLNNSSTSNLSAPSFPYMPNIFYTSSAVPGGVGIGVDGLLADVMGNVPTESSASQRLLGSPPQKPTLLPTPAVFDVLMGSASVANKVVGATSTGALGDASSSVNSMTTASTPKAPLMSNRRFSSVAAPSVGVLRSPAFSPSANVGGGIGVNERLSSLHLQTATSSRTSITSPQRQTRLVNQNQHHQSANMRDQAQQQQQQHQQQSPISHHTAMPRLNGIVENGTTTTANGFPDVFSTSNQNDYWNNVEALFSTMVTTMERLRYSILLFQQKAKMNQMWGEKFQQQNKQRQQSSDLKIEEVKRKADAVVQEVKTAAVNELQKAVLTAERKALHMIASERSQMERLIKDTNKQEDSLENCWNCGRRAGQTCSGCGRARYCGIFCQHKDWTRHRDDCGPTVASTSSSVPDAAVGVQDNAATADVNAILSTTTTTSKTRSPVVMGSPTTVYGHNSTSLSNFTVNDMDDQNDDDDDDNNNNNNKTGDIDIIQRDAIRLATTSSLKRDDDTLVVVDVSRRPSVKSVADVTRRTPRSV